MPNRSSPRPELAEDEEADAPVTAEPFAPAFGARGLADAPGLADVPVFPEAPLLPDASGLPAIAALPEVPILPAAPLLPDTLVPGDAACTADAPTVALPTMGRLRNRKCCCPRVHTLVVTQ